MSAEHSATIGWSHHSGDFLKGTYSRCHMLTYLYRAHRAGFNVRSYDDHAIGRTGKNDRGAAWVSEVELRPRVVYSVREPSPGEEERLHHAAHQECTIANSVAMKITVVSSPRR